MKAFYSTLLSFICISFSASAFTITSVVTNVSCNGINNGAIDINPVGGTAPYTFSWSNGKTTEDIDSLTAGTYTVTVTDATSTLQTGTYTVTQTSALMISGTVNNTTCYGGTNGSIGLGFSQGSGAYSYSVNGSAPVLVNGIDENFQWMSHAGGNNSTSVDNKPYGIVSDKNGNVFITGEFFSSLYIGNTTLVSAGNSDMFLAKYAPDGTLLWAQRTGSTDYDSGFGIAADTTGNIFVTGRFRGTVAFGSFTLTATSGDDLFVAKYDNNGNCLWVNHPASTNTDAGWAIATDKTGNCYVTGYFALNITFGTLPTMSSSAGTNVFTVKIDPSGTALWSKRAGGTGTANNSSAIALDGLNNIYITGYFTNNFTFGSSTVTSTGSRDVFIAKYNNTGTEQWIRAAGNSSGDDQGKGICVDAANNVYTTGYFKNSINFGSGVVSSGAFADEIFLVKFNPAGTALWTQKAGGSMFDEGYSVSSDQFNNIYMTGTYQGSAAFGSFVLPAPGTTGLFVAKYNSAGTVQLAKPVYTSALGHTEGYSIFSDKKGSTYLAGMFTGSVNFGPIPATSSGREDVFASRFSMTNAADTIHNLSAGNYTISLSDFNGCTTTNSFSVSEPMVLKPAFIVTPPLCYGGNGSAALNITGGTAPYTQSWGSANPNALPAGNYPVTVTDSVGCDTTIAITMTEPSPILTTNLIANTYCGNCNGSATIYPTGGTAGYTYLWCNGNTAPTGINLCAGSCPVTIADNNGCTITDTVVIGSVPPLALSMSSSADTVCNGMCATLNADATGGSPTYTYLWSPGGSLSDSTIFDPVACPGISTTYSVTITDLNGCTVTGSQLVHVDFCTGIAEQNKNVISVYPNPFTSVVHLNFGASSVCTISVYNSIGKLVLKKTVHEQQTDLNTEAWDKGIYLLQISNSTFTKTVDIIKD